MQARAEMHPARVVAQQHQLQQQRVRSTSTSCFLVLHQCCPQWRPSRQHIQRLLLGSIVFALHRKTGSTPRWSAAC